MRSSRAGRPCSRSKFVAVAFWRKRDALLCGTDTFCSPGSPTGATGSMRGSAVALEQGRANVRRRDALAGMLLHIAPDGVAGTHNLLRLVLVPSRVGVRALVRFLLDRHERLLL